MTLQTDESSETFMRLPDVEAYQVLLCSHWGRSREGNRRFGDHAARSIMGGEALLHGETPGYPDLQH